MYKFNDFILFSSIFFLMGCGVRIHSLKTSKKPIERNLVLQSTERTLSGLQRVESTSAIWGPNAVFGDRLAHSASVLHVGGESAAHAVVFIAGGSANIDDNAIAECLIYQPSENRFQHALPMPSPRSFHASAVIRRGADQHEAVLLVGGFSDPVNNPITPMGDAIIYDPQDGPGGAPAWISAGALNVARGNATLTSLPNGKLFLVGGTVDRYDRDGFGYRLSSAEIYDPLTNLWTLVSAMPTPRSQHVASFIRVGADAHAGVLVVAGWDDTTTRNDAIYYDFGTFAWISAGALGFDTGGLSAVGFPDGSVWVGGGQGSDYTKHDENRRYVPTVNSIPSTIWNALPNMPDGRASLTATGLSNGDILTMGGFDGGGYILNVDRYSLVSNTWSTVTSNLVSRYRHTATALPDGRVLIFGGSNSNGNQILTQANSSEIFQTYEQISVPSPSSGIAPYTFRLIAGRGTVFPNGSYVPYQFDPEVAKIEVRDFSGASAVFTVTTQ